MESAQSSELGPSELGTKEYWTHVYEQDKINYKDHGDIGEIWFGEDSGMRILRWITKNHIPLDKRIIDLGCGNGMMLIELAREGFTNLTGVDYCENAIELSRSIIASQSIDCITLKVADLTGTSHLGKYDVVLDKGTYDAITLSPVDAKSKMQAYKTNVADMLNDDGLFVITSCNWTESELVLQFAPELIKKCVIPTPTFNFGGKTGNIVTSAVFGK